MMDSFAATTGANIKSAGISVRFTQAALSRRSGISRSQIVKMEAGRVIPQLDEAVRIADVLHIPIQRLLTGKTKPSVGLNGIAHELHNLGITDLVVSDAEVPGAFRRSEQVIALALSGDRPEVRIVEAIPYVLSQTKLHVRLAISFAELYDPRVKYRLAWLSDVTLVLARKGIVAIAPDVERPLERLTKTVKKPETRDDLGSPGTRPKSPIWRRWNMDYSGTLQEFAERARLLDASRIG